MAAILAPRLSPKSPREQHSPAKLTLDHLAKAAMVSKSSSLSPAKSDSGSSSNTAVSEYENQIQNDLWPIDCIKCNSTLTSLDNFNIHMNDHWWVSANLHSTIFSVLKYFSLLRSDDKCCPVCGLLINSKRFNFKQHLKIHTGEKPFVCQVCNRAFRQKAHMVSEQRQNDFFHAFNEIFYRWNMLRHIGRSLGPCRIISMELNQESLFNRHHKNQLQL